ncbi:MAG: hypothetical protein HKP27_10130 [Myxococcales bacterium]|nr:hypothetical protein [Myxococcales bacterium]
MSQNQGTKDLSKGEGNREADRRYREGASDFAESGRVEEAAERAKEELKDDSSEEQRPA